jgi:hypothetical protein
LLLDEAPARVAKTIGIVAVPSAALVLLGRQSGFATVAEPRVPGWVLVLAAGAAALVCATLAHRFAKATFPLERPHVRLLAAAIAVCAALVLAVVVVYGSTTEPRASYYRVAWHDEYTAHPLFGSGAGTFALFWTRSGRVASRGGALDAHSLYLETLAELGPLGLVLLAAFLLYPLRGVVTNRRSPYVPVAAAAYVAFLVHAALDWDWELPVVVVAALSCAAAVVSSTVSSASRIPTWARAAVLGAALVLAALAIAGVRSDTVPAASGETKGAPLSRGP